ncbi:MAG: hypothetical protein HC837_05090 [Chloroflexaceae bacterium]|nr:hypothetical protein [Chloroflexaceae bacterium]
MPADPYIFGIRHHGPGSAHSLLQALEQLRPDILLVEGPPDAAEVLPLVNHPQMDPPVALLIYVPDDPRLAVYYPFARFSPEWQALSYGLTQHIPVRFMDLPQAHQMAIEQARQAPAEAETDAAETPTNAPPETEQAPAEAESTAATDDPTAALADDDDPRRDPLGVLARAAGYSDGERWWEHMVEQRRDSTDLFVAIQEAMTAVRAETPPPANPLEAEREAQREAWMRQAIRQAQREGFERIAVVCGAWHGPALATMPPVKEDTKQLKGLPKAKVKATWVPWTYDRLSMRSGYGAGIESPGWYRHLFQSAQAGLNHTDVIIHWMTHVARLLRSEHLDASSAHIIEAVRLAETLAALRDSPLPGLPEMNEAARAIFCFDSDAPMRLIHEQLIVGNELGSVPEDTPLVPLQGDLQREQRRLRLKPEANWRDLDLDLRKENDRDRSYLLHRLQLIDVPWGELRGSDRAKGTFWEKWRIQWLPELAIKLIEAGVWGNTIYEAAGHRVRVEADGITNLPALSRLIHRVLLAHLPDAIPDLTLRLQNQAALTTDVGQMMQALPDLASILRYGDVRKTDTEAVGHVVDSLVTRICIGLPGACSSLDDDAASEMFKSLIACNQVITMLQQPEQHAAWQGVLQRLADQTGLHGLLAGRCIRLLFDQHALDAAEVARRMGLECSPANPPEHAASWIEGFLVSSGEILVHDHVLWQVIDSWVMSLTPSVFEQLLPLLRRTFSTFAAPVRRRLGERVRTAAEAGPTVTAHHTEQSTLDHERAARVLPVVARLLGIESTPLPQKEAHDPTRPA